MEHVPVPAYTIDAELLKTAIRDANYHMGGLRCLLLFQLTHDFFAEVKREVERICDAETGSSVSDPGHITHWTGPRGEVRQFSLLNASGRFDDFRTDHDMSCLGKRFHHADRYPSLNRLIRLFPHCVNFRINTLGARSRLSAHEEHSVVLTRSGTVALRLRLHLPVLTNSGAVLTLDGEVYHLEPGSVYFINHGCVHSARNSGESRRVHLVWDMLLTREVFRSVFEQATDNPWVTRPAGGIQIPAFVKTERMGAYVGLPPLVRREDADVIS